MSRKTIRGLTRDWANAKNPAFHARKQQCEENRVERLSMAQRIRRANIKDGNTNASVPFYNRHTYRAFMKSN